MTIVEILKRMKNKLGTNGFHTNINIAAALLLVTAIIHLAYPFLYHESEKTTPVAIFGVLYFILSLGLLMRGNRYFLYAATILTTIGMIAATVTYVNNPSPYDLDIVLILFDVVIVPLFWWGIFKK